MTSFEQCCNPGTVWEGTPSGKVVTLGGLDTYIALPPSGKATKTGILVINDVFGYEAKNIRLFTDRLAKAGFVAVCPDFFRGDWLTKEKYGDKSFKLPDWLGQFPQDQVMDECEKIFEEVKSSHGVESFGAIGFCWGGLFACKLNASGAVKASVANHCSLLAHNKPVLDEIAHPILFQCSDNDSQIPTEFRHEIEEKLRAKPFAKHTMVKFYPGQEHGWTLRGDDKDPSVQWAAEDAFIAGLYFLQVHL